MRGEAQEGGDTCTHVTNSLLSETYIALQGNYTPITKSLKKFNLKKGLLLHRSL